MKIKCTCVYNATTRKCKQVSPLIGFVDTGDNQTGAATPRLLLIGAAGVAAPGLNTGSEQREH